MKKRIVRFVISAAVMLVLLLPVRFLTACGQSLGHSLTREEFGEFSFSLTWGCYGISSYDSGTGELIKTTDTTHPEDYVTTCRLSEEEMLRIFDIVSRLNVESYPDVYNPHRDGFASEPPMTLVLTVHTDSVQKTITAKNIAYSFSSPKVKGQAFLSACEEIKDILTGTDEWQALPDYEYYYD